MKTHRLIHRFLPLCAALALVPTAALADGSGTLSEAALALDYTSPAYFVPNTSSDAYALGDVEPVCEEGTPTCDVYTLTIQFSDSVRNDPAFDNVFIDILMEFASATGQAADVDFDMFVYDSAGKLFKSGAIAGGPEMVSLPLYEFPNGTYKVKVVPYMPAGESFTHTIRASGFEGAKSRGVLGAGAPGLALLLPLALAALRRRASV